MTSSSVAGHWGLQPYWANALDAADSAGPVASFNLAGPLLNLILEEKAALLMSTQQEAQICRTRLCMRGWYSELRDLLLMQALLFLWESGWVLVHSVAHKQEQPLHGSGTEGRSL